jgi:glucose/arabinose dehydrogenase
MRGIASMENLNSSLSRHSKLLHSQAFGLLLGFALFFQTWIGSAAVPSGFTQFTYVTGLTEPTSMVVAPDGRLFICEKSGKLRVVSATGTLLPTPFVDLTSKISQGNERGLLGVTLDPNFSANGFVYVFYTANAPAVHSRVSRFTANGNVAVAGSEFVVFDLDNLSSNDNHNGGGIHFGTDGRLYIASGDNRNPGNAQNMSNTHGKILRVAADGTIPTDNPFYAQTSGKARAIYALGFRNPFTFAVDSISGEIYVNDVGEGSREEVNNLLAGENYGWPIYEGPGGDPRYEDPIYSYSHAEGCSINGATFYNPATVQFPPEYVGRYFFADLCGGWVRQLDPNNGDAVSGFATGYANPVDVDVATDGTLLVLDIGNGSVGKIRSTASQPPQIVSQPASKTVGTGQTATFSVSASGTPPLSYQWQRNNVDIAGATSSSYTTPSLTRSDSGSTFRCRVTNSFGTAMSNSATLTVLGQAPVVTIDAPTAGTLYTAGQPVSFSGSATDAEDGTLPASAFTWDVDFHHNDTGEHMHPADPPVSGVTSGSFTPSQTEEFSPNVWYRIHLRVRDSEGVTTSTYRDVFPRTAQLNFVTQPTGLRLVLDGIPFAAPKTVTGVTGVLRQVEATSPQVVGADTYEFVSWSDGGTAAHTIQTPSTATTYTAVFRKVTDGSTGIITFDDRAGQNQTLSGVYPTGVIDWGTGVWYHSAPWKKLATKSISFNASGATSATFRFLTPRRLMRIDAYNGGTTTSTVTIAAPGQPSKQVAVLADQLVTINTGWTGNVGTVTISSSNGWDTNFDNLVYDTVGSVPDTTPPQLTAISATDVASTSARIVWTTDEGSDSQVEYGTSTAYGSTTSLDSNLVTSHSVNLSGLTAATTYHYRVKSRDSAGNLAISGNFTFTTQTPNALPQVSITSPSAGQTFTAPAQVTINANASDSDGTVTKVEFFQGSTKLGEDTSAPYSFVWSSVPAGNYTITAKAIDNGGASASASVSIVVQSAPGNLVVTFDDLSGQNQVLNGQYPSGLINWGSGVWYHSSPWGKFTTKSISFNGSGMTTASFQLLTPKRLVRLQAFNGGGTSSTVTLSSPGLPSKQVTIAANQVVTIDTGWTATSTTISISSSNGWDTNFDTLEFAD